MMKKPFDSLPVSRFDKFTPGTGCVEQLFNSDWPEDGLQDLQDSQCVQGLCTWNDYVTDMVRCWQAIRDCDTEN